MLGQYKALLHRCDGDAQRSRFVAQKVVPVFKALQLELMLSEIFNQSFTPPGRFCADKHTPREVTDETFQSASRISGPSVHGYIRKGVAGAIYCAAALGCIGCCGHPGEALEVAKQLVLLQEKACGRKNRSMPVVATVFEAVSGFSVKVRDGFVQPSRREHMGCAGQIIEQRGGVIKKERQVILYARRGNAVTDVLINGCIFIRVWKLLEPAPAKG